MKTSYFHVLLSIVIIVFAGLGYMSYQRLQFSFEDVTPQSTLTEKSGIEPTPVTTTENTDTATTTVETQADSVPAQTSAPTQTEKTIPSKYKKLADKLQGLVTDNITMKSTSRGTRVGTVEEFMNIYDSANIKPTNQYTASLVTRVTSFQTAQGITPANGLANPDTYKKMIDWLKTQ